MSHLHRHWTHRCHICTGTGLAFRFICTGTALAPATSAPLGLGSPLASPGPGPPCHICAGTGTTLPHLHQTSSAPGLRSSPATSAPGAGLGPPCRRAVRLRAKLIGPGDSVEGRSVVGVHTPAQCTIGYTRCSAEHAKRHLRNPAHSANLSHSALQSANVALSSLSVIWTSLFPTVTLEGKLCAGMSP